MCIIKNMATVINYSNSHASCLNCVYMQSQNNINGGDQYIYINNSISIPYSSMNANNHANAAIYMKDISLSNSSEIYWNKLNASDQDLKFNNYIVLNEYNASDMLANIFINESSNVSNIIITGNYTPNAYINFHNGSNLNEGSNGVGFRYNATVNKLQYNNDGLTWYDIISVGNASLEDLDDVLITNLLNNQYLTWNSGSNQWINSNLSIFNDKTAQLGSNLNLNTYGIHSNSFICYNGQGSNIITKFESVGNSGANYLTFYNSNSGAEPTIIPVGIDADIGINLNTKGDGTIALNTGVGNVAVNSNHIEITGFIKNSIYRTSSNASYLPNNNWTIPISSDIILFDFSNASNVGTYWANISSGIEGQKLNLLMYNSNTAGGISILADFGNNNLCSGNGFASKLKFIKNGQGASLVYIGDPQNIWHILNTGSQVI